MDIRPLHDRVIVKRLEPETVTASGIVLAENFQEKPDQGRIISVGKGRLMDDGSLQPLEVNVGELVLFGKYAGSMFKHDGEEYLTMREEDIIGVIEE
jgi:chaperonin GroES